MKSATILVYGVLSLALGHATTVDTAGGNLGRTFGYSIAGVFTPFNGAGAATAELEVGRFVGSTFVEFPSGVNGTSTLGFADGSGFINAGKWTGTASDTSGDADAFNGSQIWFEVSTTIGVESYVGYFSVPATNFPTNAGGAADDVTVNSTSLVFDQSRSTGVWAVDTVNNRIVLTAIPEPSSILLGTLGAAFLFRRRRM